MFQSPADIARSIESWAELPGVKLPKALQAALDTYDAIRWTEVEHQPVFPLSKVTADNAEQLVRDFAEQLLPSLGVVANQGGQDHSAMWLAKRTALDLAARAVIGQAADAVENIIGQLRPMFDKHAEAYVEAVSMLPDDLSDRSLIAAGPDAVGAFGIAQSEARFLRGIAGWLTDTSRLPGHIADITGLGIKAILGPGAPQKPSNANPTLEAVDPVLFLAAKAGVEFRLLPLREALQARQPQVTLS